MITLKKLKYIKYKKKVISTSPELLKITKLIIWDEAPMCHKFNFETLDKNLKDIMHNDRLFGGKVIVFCGDFRQILPVVPRGNRYDIIHASLNASYI